MAAYKAFAIVFDYVLALGLTIVVYRSLRRPLSELLDRVADLSAATTFYLRTLFLILLFVALSKIVDSKFDLKPGAHFMEYVWGIAANLSGMFENFGWSLLVYLALITVLVATLRKKNGK